MLKVNLYNIKMILSGKNGINTILDNYETDILEIFNTIEDIYTNYWQDGISLRFKDEMIIEKSNSLKFLSCLQERKTLINYIYNNYLKIGMTIYYEKNNKMNYLNNLKNIISSLKVTENNLGNIYVSNNVYANNNLKETLRKLKNVRYKLNNYYIKVSNLVKQIEEIEASIKAKINSLTDYYVKTFEFNLDNLSTKSIGYAKMDVKEVNSKLNGINKYTLDEEDNLKYFIRSMDSLIESYNSENKDKLNNDLASISKYKNDIVDNRIKYRKVISNVADEYSSTVKNVKTSFSNNVGEV